MSFDAGSIIAHMDLDDAEFDRKLKADVARIEEFERRSNKSKLSVELDQSGMTRARQQFQRFDQQITQDAQQRARSRGSVLGALMGIFGGHAAAGTAGGSGGSGRSLLGGLLGGAGPVPTGIPVGSRALLAATGGAVGLGALPGLLGGVLPLGVAGLGLGVVGAGASTLIGSKTKQGPLYQQAQDAMKSIKSALDAGIQPLIGPLRQAFGEIPKLLRSIGPQLRQLFSGAGTLIMPVLRALTSLARTVLPLLGQAFRATAPLIGPLIGGFTKLLGGLLPGLIALLRAAAPAVHALAGILGELGSGIGMMLRSFAPAVRASSVIFKALGDVLAAIFPIIGKLAGVFARDLAPVFVIFAGVIRQLLPYLTIIGKVLASLAGAVLQDLVSLFGAFAKLLVLIAPSVRILAGALSQMFTILESSGTFGALSSALEAIVPSLAKLINQLVRQLAPELPIIIQAFAEFSTILVTLAAAGLTTLLNAVTWLIEHTPRWVFLLGLAAGAFFLLDAAIAANPIGATILAILALVGAVTLLARHWGRVWGDIKNWAQDAWQFLTHGWGQLLIPGLTAIRYAVEFVRDHWRQAWDDIKGIGLAAWNFLHDDVFAPIANFITNTLPGAFRSAVTAIGNGWDAIKNVVRAPVAWVIDHVLDGLISAFDWISSKVGGPHINPVHPFGLATGGRIPGYGGGDRHLALLEGGEAVVSKETTSAHAADLSAWGVPGFQHGGRVGDRSQNGRFGDLRMPGGDPFGPLGGLLKGIYSTGRIMAAVATGNSVALTNAIRALTGHGTGGAVGDMAGLLAAIPRTLIKDAVSFLIGHFAGSGNEIVKYALEFLGKIPYVWGGTTYAGDDCSGFTQEVYRHFGYNPPRTAAQQGAWVNRGAPVPGGLVFFGSPPFHVGLAMDSKRMISQGGPEGVLGPTIASLGGMSWAGTPPGGFRGGFRAKGRWTLPGLENLWDQAGGPPSRAHIAAAIALAESGGDPLAYNPSGATGLWQILGQVFPGNLRNPLVNALNAVTKYRAAGGFSPWVTFETGAYRQFMDGGGRLHQGTNLLYKRTSSPEVVLNPSQTDAFLALAAAAERSAGGGSSELAAAIRAMHGELARLLKRAPGATGAAVGDALDGGSRIAALRAQYSAR